MKIKIVNSIEIPIYPEDISKHLQLPTFKKTEILDNVYDPDSQLKPGQLVWIEGKQYEILEVME